MSSALESLDTLIDEFRHALAQEDWDTLNRVNETVQPAIESAVAEIHSRGDDPEVLRERLADLQKLMADASKNAGESRDQAARELRGMSQNRQAVQAYANVRTGGRRS